MVLPAYGGEGSGFSIRIYYIHILLFMKMRVNLILEGFKQDIEVSNSLMKIIY